MSIVPLAEWYPDMYRRWLRDGRRYRAPDRVGYTVHQTEGGVGIGELAYARSVANFHYWTREWERPGGYNFQIGAQGTIFEMCGWEFVGAHAPGGNRPTIGVAFQGTFGTSLPNAKQLAAFSWLVANHHVPNVQYGHRDWSSTTCPGSALYRALPLDVTEPEDEDDDMARSGLARISNGDKVYDYCGHALVRVKTRHQAAIAVWLRTNEPGTAADIAADHRWQQHVANLSRGEAGHLTIIENLDGSGGEAFTWSEADERYARKGHGHTGTVEVS